jgi:WD40 repeat protein
MQNHTLLGALTVLVWLTAPAARAGEWVKDWRRPAAHEISVAFSPDGRTFALLDARDTIRLWDVATRKEKKPLSLALGADEIPEQVFYTGGDLVVLLCQYKGLGRSRKPTSACLWNLTSGKRSPPLKIDYDCLAVCPKRKLLATDSDLWDVSTGRKRRSVPLPKGWVFEITFSPNSKSVLYRISESLAQDFAMLVLVDVATGKKVFQLGEIDWRKDNCGFYFAPRFSPDGKLLACSRGDKPAIHLWDVTGAKPVQRIGLKTSEQVVGFLSGNRRLLTWERLSGRLRIWDTATGKERRAFKVSPRANEVLLSPDGKTLVVLKGKALESRGLED